MKAANHSGIHVQNRAQIVDDLLNLARAEYVNYTIALSGLEYLKRESAYIPWLAAFNNLAYVTSRLKGDDFEQYKVLYSIFRKHSNVFQHFQRDMTKSEIPLDADVHAEYQ